MKAPFIRAPRCLLRTDSHCADPGACIAAATCVERVKVRQQLAGAKRKPVQGAPLRSARR
jgi:hypothetical protein